MLKSFSCAYKPDTLIYRTLVRIMDRIKELGRQVRRCGTSPTLIFSDPWWH